MPLVAFSAARKPQVSSGQRGLGGIQPHFRQPDSFVFRGGLALLIRLQQLAETILREDLVNPAHLTRLSSQFDQQFNIQSVHQRRSSGICRSHCDRRVPTLLADVDLVMKPS